jgi:hypothetical protein
MGPSEVEEILFDEPFVPLRITVAGGDQIVVDNPRRALLSGLSLYYGIADNPESRHANRVKIISIPNIVLIERIDTHPRRNGRRRR